MKVIGQIDLSKFEKKKKPFLNLSGELESLSLKLNFEIENKYGFENLINQDCSVSIDAFSDKNFGIYSDKEIEEDKIKVDEIESGFIGLYNENVRKYYKEKYNAETDKEIKIKWKENKDKQKSTNVEKLMILLLNKAMGDKFIIVKSSNYDDYTAGVDYLIIDKENGNVVGAFDGVAENDNSSGNKNTLSKEEKINRIIKKGGASMKYGFRIKNGKLEMTKLENLPIFYLGLSDLNYNKLGESIDDKKGKGMTENEKKVFSDLISSLNEQIKSAKTNQNINPNLLNNINQFEESIKSYK